eukprot:TRINITY_DN96188_c0_g1_i3.p3 TRINITY_DN96188_c0_g1~~TRINITY_DN96188_c0_g1_i3.p3  ORF type:complete len:131 (+),score=5.61 TRINITY_DN96188_c0_g1_i3:244-636(+)
MGLGVEGDEAAVGQFGDRSDGCDLVALAVDAGGVEFSVHLFGGRSRRQISSALPGLAEGVEICRRLRPPKRWTENSTPPASTARATRSQPSLRSPNCPTAASSPSTPSPISSGTTPCSSGLPPTPEQLTC